MIAEGENKSPAIPPRAELRVLWDRQLLKRPASYEVDIQQCQRSRRELGFRRIAEGDCWWAWSTSQEWNLEARTKRSQYTNHRLKMYIWSFPRTWRINPTFQSMVVGQTIYATKKGENYTDAFFSVVRYDSLRVLLAHITQQDLEMDGIISHAVSFPVRRKRRFSRKC